MRLLRTVIAAGLLSVALGPAAPVTAFAVDRSYEQAIVAARGLVREAINGSRDRIPDAIRTLQDGTGSTQPEIVADLRATPPNLEDADARLAAVEAALNRPGDAGDPAAAKKQVRDIINLPRYDSMRGGPSAWDRFVAWVVQLIAGLLLYILINTSISPQLLYALVAGLVLVLGAGVALLVRTNLNRGGGSATAGREELRTALRDRFAAADRLAASGEFTDGLRELVAGVAGEVGNRPFWDSSPLTVRELFASQDLLDELGPLLAPFEASVYGRRKVSRSEFREAAKAAARFREAVPEVAA